MKALKIISLLCLTAVALSAASPDLNKVEVKEKEKMKSWTFCCTHKSHRTLRNSACIVTSTRYKDYKSCRSRVNSHKKAYPSHSCGCR